MKLNENFPLTSLTSKTSLVNQLHGYAGSPELTKIKQPRQTQKFTLVKASLFSGAYYKYHYCNVWWYDV